MKNMAMDYALVVLKAVKESGYDMDSAKAFM